METQLGYLLEVLEENTSDTDVLTAGDLKKYINLALTKHEEAEERLDQEFNSTEVAEMQEQMVQESPVNIQSIINNITSY